MQVFLFTLLLTFAAIALSFVTLGIAMVVFKHTKGNRWIAHRDLLISIAFVFGMGLIWLFQANLVAPTGWRLFSITTSLWIMPVAIILMIPQVIRNYSKLKALLIQNARSQKLSVTECSSETAEASSPNG